MVANHADSLLNCSTTIIKRDRRTIELADHTQPVKNHPSTPTSKSA
jgi:hypothetical protein